jgi:hypothetical protein
MWYKVTASSTVEHKLVLIHIDPTDKANQSSIFRNHEILLTTPKTAQNQFFEV